MAEISNAVGKKQEALAYTKRAEQIRSRSGVSYLNYPILELYRMVGSESDYRRLEAEGERAQEERKRRKLDQEERLRALALKMRPGVISELRPTLNEKDKREQPGLFSELEESLDLQRPEKVLDKYSLNYVALAQSLLWLESADVLKYPTNGPSYSFAGACELLNSVQPTRRVGNLLFLYDGQPGTLVPKTELQNIATRPNDSAVKTPSKAVEIFTGPPPVMARPFKPALNEPPNAKPLPGASAEFVLEPGNYAAQQMLAKNIVLNGSGPVRIFLKDPENQQPAGSLYIERAMSYLSSIEQIPEEKPVFEAPAQSRIDLVPGKDALSSHSRLEIWYGGQGEIRVGDDSSFRGVIYAPNATVRLGRRVEFLGAIVADVIIAGEKSKLMYDPSLRYWQVAQ